MNFKDVQIAFFGNSEFSKITLEEMKRNGVIPDLIVTTPDKPQGRKMELTSTPTKVWAEENSIECIEPTKLKDSDFLGKISKYNLYIVASYGKILPKELLDIPKYGVLNIHPSILPKYRGSSPLQEQILNDEKEVGVTIMLMDEQIDHGPIVDQEIVEIEDWPVGFNKLQEILAKEGAKLLSDILQDWVSNKIKAKVQDHTHATFTKKTEKVDGLINLADNPRKNYLKILAYEDWPGTYFEIDIKGKKTKVIIKKASLSVNELDILEVVPEGKRKMDYRDFLRGLK